MLPRVKHTANGLGFPSMSSVRRIIENMFKKSPEITQPAKPMMRSCVWRRRAIRSTPRSDLSALVKKRISARLGRRAASSASTGATEHLDVRARAHATPACGLRSMHRRHTSYVREQHPPLFISSICSRRDGSLELPSRLERDSWAASILPRPATPHFVPSASPLVGSPSLPPRPPNLCLPLAPSLVRRHEKENSFVTERGKHDKSSSRWAGGTRRTDFGRGTQAAGPRP